MEERMAWGHKQRNRQMVHKKSIDKGQALFLLPDVKFFFAFKAMFLGLTVFVCAFFWRFDLEIFYARQR